MNEVYSKRKRNVDGKKGGYSGAYLYHAMVLLNRPVLVKKVDHTLGWAILPNGKVIRH